MTERREEQGKTCPIMSAGSQFVENCHEDKCAWWVSAVGATCGHCIMQELGHLSDISDELYNKTRGEQR